MSGDCVARPHILEPTSRCKIHPPPSQIWQYRSFRLCIQLCAPAPPPLDFAPRCTANPEAASLSLSPLFVFFLRKHRMEVRASRRSWTAPSGSSATAATWLGWCPATSSTRKNRRQSGIVVACFDGVDTRHPRHNQQCIIPILTPAL